MIPDSSGNLYGTTYSGGAYGGGVVYKLDTSGKETVLYNFCSESGCADGEGPIAGVIRDSVGNLYGTTFAGGDSACTSTAEVYGCGVVYKLDTSGSEAVLYTFTGGADGANPYAAVVRDSAGNLYGTADWGGKYNVGVVFKLKP